ncbi:MAG: hypothetical protein OXG34_11015 [bacterium]|nr:hypothetical protein [bacterium]
MPTIAIEMTDNEIRHVADVALPDPEDPFHPFGLSPTRFSAIVDTGSTHTGVTQKVVDALEAEQVGVAMVSYAGNETVRTPTYKMVVGIPIMETEEQGGTRTYVRGESLLVELIPDREDGTDIILGIDLLQSFHITMYGSQCIISN